MRISNARRADLKAHEATARKAAKRNAFSHGAVIASVGVGGAADIARAATRHAPDKKSGLIHCRPGGHASCPNPPTCSNRMARN
ncbi:hypothetical protein [Rhizobium leguminosarum]|uniref:hypothetical protein n=1 Tax=Rhizobium leguminosarum TaxID=384 RepID=UPI0019D41C40|nr:hypothetical protein [Rhizobium leguminosarum]